MAIRFSGGKNTYEVLPQGTYDFEIKSVEQGTSKSNNPQLKVQLEVVEGPLAGKKTTHWYSLLPQAAWRLSEFAAAAGGTMVDTGEVDEKGEPIMELDENSLVGLFVRGTIEHREYQGRTNADLNKPVESPFGVEPAAPAGKAPAASTQSAAATQPANGEAPGAPAVAPRRRRPEATS